MVTLQRRNARVGDEDDLFPELADRTALPAAMGQPGGADDMKRLVSFSDSQALEKLLQE